MEPLYESKISCICCETVFITTRVRPSFKKATAVDSDFCGHYAKGTNPEFYVVRVCPKCGFASTENGFSSLSEVQRKSYYERIGNNWRGQNFSGERSIEEAMMSYKLALLTAQVTDSKDRVIASILHHIAWLYRYQNNETEEKKFLTFALEAYIRVFETEGISLNNAKLMYLIGELSRRTGEFNEAVKWFSRVVNDKKIVDAAMIRACREQWQLIREESEARRLSLSGTSS
ncbi:DUF2225 domain-containing protein [Paenibacillus sp. GSMTC-2017]|uniref:DUF2225 domain-containing protein n=1 Tax=Paenibacillus sp. GSMTC-2017 TaxID=2794350 RepID=UPI0018D7547C|nr:DUF2225 domain-containing protein [Paenibacillus sp. GSMTC-2017]MBH5317483.1 DUF2225 domain-containing protein [Paenibacillus sp. GSMTC-2017]